MTVVQRFSGHVAIFPENGGSLHTQVNKEVAQKKKAKEDADDLIAKAKGIDTDIKVCV